MPDGVIDPDEFETIRYSPHVPSRTRRLLPLLTSIMAIIAVVAAGYFGGNAYLSSRFFLGPDQDRVAIYQGVPDTVFGQQPFARHIETSQVPVGDLPKYYASQLTNGELRNYESLDVARQELARLDELAERCRADRAASASPKPTSTPRTPFSTRSAGSAQSSGSASDAVEGTSTPASSANASATNRTPTPTHAPATATSSPRPDQDPCG